MRYFHFLGPPILHLARSLQNNWNGPARIIMAAWFLKSRSSLQFVKIRSGVHEIFNRSLFCGLAHHCNNFVTSSNVHCSHHVSFLRLPGYWVGFQASQHSKAFKLEKDSACSENEVPYCFSFISPIHLLNKSSNVPILRHVQVE